MEGYARHTTQVSRIRPGSARIYYSVMNRTLIGLALFAGSLLLGGQEQPRRVEAKEPTVVMVHGSSERVEPVHPKRKKSRFKLGALKTLTGAGKSAGWLLNVDDDIPSSRERSFRSRPARQ